MADPTDTLPKSLVQQEIDRRIRCYREALVRHLYLKTEAFERDHGWVDAGNHPTAKKMWYVLRPADDAPEAEKQAWNNLPIERLLGDMVMSLEGNTPPIYTACDVLDFKRPPAVPCDDLADHPVVRVPEDGSSTDDFFQAIARFDLADAEPGRQAELYGWTTPDPKNLPAVAAFEQAKTRYWAAVCASPLMFLETLKETADFKASELVRLLYLAGDVPPHLRAAGAPWRRATHLDRDVNFSAEVEAHISKALREFKYWVDDPFFVNGAFNGDDRKLVIKAVRRAKALEKRPPLSPEAIESEVSASIGDKEIPEEMTFWSENHQVLFASSEYLAGQWLRDDVFRAGLALRGEGVESTRPGDMTGEQRMRHARPRLIRWLDDRLRLGFSEWNALPYYEEDLGPLFNLVDFCLDEDIRSRAEIVLDQLLFDLARYSLNGNFGPSAGRCYADKKMCGLEPGVVDLIEVLFGNRRVITWAGTTSAGSFSSSRRYVVPEVLVKIGQDRPRRLVDRSRVSLRFDEAETFGAGFQTLEDAMFWWSRSAYVTKHTVLCTRRIAARYHLEESGPFLALLPMLETISGLATPVTFLTSDNPSAVAVVDTLSPLTEGSALTRANLYSYQNRHAMLCSVQNFRRGQFNAQTQVCQATLSPGATVWTTHPSAGGNLSAALLGAIGGGIVGSAFGPAGTIVGAWAGGVVGTIAKPGGIELIPAGDDGPNWWTGSASLPRVVQRDGGAIIAYQPGELLRRLLGDKTHAWFPKHAFDEGSVTQQRSSDCNISSATWTFGRVGDGYVGLFSAREVEWTTMGPWADKELVADNGRNIFILQVGNIDEFESYERFKDKVSAARVHINGLRVMTADFECSYDLPSPGGGRLELHIDDDEVRYNGTAFSDDNFPRYETPYVKCGRVGWAQYHYTIAFGDSTLTHDFRELKTRVEGATVHRDVDRNTYDCAQDRFRVVSNRGARRVFPENTLEACRHAVEQEGAMALLVDACLTADGEVALWHDWSPNDFTAVLRQLGTGDLGAYRPSVPDADDPQRVETIALTLAQFRFFYGYELTTALHGAAAAPFAIPTLAELIDVARGWAGLRHLLINIRMPPEHAAAHGSGMIARIIESGGGTTPFDTTVLVADQEVLAAMQAFVGTSEPPPIAFAVLSMATEYPKTEDGFTDFTARAAVIREHSAVEAAIRTRSTGAVMSRIPSENEATFDDYVGFVAYDVGRLEPYNLNPRANHGHQVEWLLATVRDAPMVMQLLLDTGVSGIITDDVPALLGVVAKAGRT